MLTPLFISGIIVASGAVLVRNLLYNFPGAEKAIKRAFGFWGKAITCEFCGYAQARMIIEK